MDDDEEVNEEHSLDGQFWKESADSRIFRLEKNTQTMAREQTRNTLSISAKGKGKGKGKVNHKEMRARQTKLIETALTDENIYSAYPDNQSGVTAKLTHFTGWDDAKVAIGKIIDKADLGDHFVMGNMESGMKMAR